MAINVGAAIINYGTRAVVHDGATQAVVNGAYSNDPVSWTNSDDVGSVSFMFSWQYASGTLADSAHVEVYVRLLNIDGTNDANVPDDDYPETLIGTIQVDAALAATTTQYAPALDIPLPAFETGQAMEFYFKNRTGVTISAGWDWDVLPNAPAVKTA